MAIGGDGDPGLFGIGLEQPQLTAGTADRGDAAVRQEGDRVGVVAGFAEPDDAPRGHIDQRGGPAAHDREDLGASAHALGIGRIDEKRQAIRVRESLFGPLLPSEGLRIRVGPPLPDDGRRVGPRPVGIEQHDPGLRMLDREDQPGLVDGGARIVCCDLRYSMVGGVGRFNMDGHGRKQSVRNVVGDDNPRLHQGERFCPGLRQRQAAGFRYQQGVTDISAMLALF